MPTEGCLKRMRLKGLLPGGGAAHGLVGDVRGLRQGLWSLSGQGLSSTLTITELLLPAEPSAGC